MEKMFRKAMSVLVVGLALSPLSPIGANEFDPQKYFTIQSVKIQDLGEGHSPYLLDATLAGPDLGDAGVVIDQIINIGKKLWTIVEKNRPVVKIELNTANALPTGVQGWNSLDGWQVPKARVYRVVYANMYGVDVVDFSFRVIYTYGGSYKGKGRYLTHVAVLPDRLSVGWGYTFTARVDVPNVVNTGTTLDPMAGVELQLSWSVDTVLKHMQNTTSYFIQGNGEFANLTAGN